MKERLRIQKKVSTQSTYNPATNPFQTRSFGIELQKKKSSSPTEDVDFDAQYEHAKRFALDLSHVPVYAPGKAAPPPIQTKLTIGQPGDKYEQEADNVAAQVVQRINDPAVEQSSQGQSVQREALLEEEEPIQAKSISDSIQREALPEEEEPIQAKSISDSIQREALPEEEEPIQAKSISDSIQREALPEEEEPIQAKSISDSIQREALPEEEEPIQAKSISDSIQREALPEEEEPIQAKSISDSIQREALPEEELQMKPEITSLQRQEEPEEELQAKSILQRREAIGGGEASTDLDAAINSARGSGQEIADNIREPMEQAFGADFSGVKVHTDGQSDQLNQSIQARAFTTGQDVFFRQGEYNPGSRGGQELLAHELTHVVQQNGGVVQKEKDNASRTQNETASTDQAGIVQPMLDNSIMRASLYRGMIESSGQPQIGSTARELGVRDSDVELDEQGNVVPGKGMSTAKGSPQNLPKHRRSSSWGGTGKDPVWEIDEANINGNLKANHDGGNHVSITTAKNNMSLEAFQKELANTQPNWTKKTP